MTYSGELFCLTVLGPFLLTMLLLDLLTYDKSSHSRVINVSSMAHRRAAPLNPDDIMLSRHKFSPSFIQYPHSKMANILFTRELARRLGQYVVLVVVVVFAIGADL